MPPLSPPPSAPRLVTVLGAAGFIGRFVVNELAQRGWQVRAFLHTAELNPFAGRPEIEVMFGDVRDEKAIRRSFAGAIAVVNLAAAKSDEPESESINVGGARTIVAAAKAVGGIRIRILHFSTQAVKIARQGLYARTKLAADRVFETSGLPVTLLRPSIVYGPGRSGVFSTMQRYVERWPVVPVLGNGRWISAPVHVEDVARAVATCLERPATVGRCYDLAGPDRISLDEILDRIAALSERRCRKVHLPFPVALTAAQLATRLLPHPPISVSNVLGSNQPIPIDSAPAQQDLGFAPMSLESGLRRLKQDAETAARSEEARLFGRYLLGVEIGPQLVERYSVGCRVLFGDSEPADLRFIRRHRWALPWLDAAAAACRPRSPLRHRLLLMAALLETCPDYAELFLAPPPQRARLVSGLVFRGLSCTVKLVLGVLLLPFTRTSCRQTRT